MLPSRRLLIALLAVTAVALAAYLVRPPRIVEPDESNTASTTNTATNQATPGQEMPGTMFTTDDLPDRDRAFDFSATLPQGWAAEYVEASNAINIFDPEANAGSSLDQSRIFVRYFKAADFQTLTTVNVLSRTPSTINGKSSVTYRISKKPGIPDFVGQPAWRNAEHTVTDIRATSGTPATFYVFAKSPDVPDDVFQRVLSSLKFAGEISRPPVYPMRDFLSRLQKKQFGLAVSPENSPVSPERFSGYHTGVDAEVSDEELSRDVEVYAIADGTLAVKQTADGYGGVVMIEHAAAGQTFSALYGHLRLSSVTTAPGERVTRGQVIGLLGRGGSTETDGERKHLHFGIRPGSTKDLRGYVETQAELRDWINPVDWLQERGAVEPTG